MQVKTVTIVGGGSSGWMTAAALSKLCPHLDVTIVESKRISTVGVGESTLGHINKFLKMLDLKDKDWMPACNATYKNSIRFTNFRENDGTFFEYPFASGLDFTDKIGGINSWAELATIYPDEFGPESFAEYFCTGNTLLAKYNKQTRNEKGLLRNFDFEWDTAYHMDAQLFGEYLKNNIALPNGVKHLINEVHSYMKDSIGNITQILCEDGTVLKSDLWIDCTGFKSLLLENWMGAQFMPFDRYLANDSAWACRLPYVDRENEMHNVTDCHALGNGWVWNIPLWNRIGTGYVYSSKFTNKEIAQAEFRDHLAKTDKKRAEEAEMFHINIRHGIRRRAWLYNVVGVGLSYGFVEPLESTGLLTTHENIVKLVEALNRRGGYLCRSEREGFNLAVQTETLRFRDFVSQHYALSMRTDTPYWRWCTQINEYCPEQMGDYALSQVQYQSLLGRIALDQAYPSDFIGNMYIAAGMGVKNLSTKSLIMNSGSRVFVPQKEEEIGHNRRRYLEYKKYLEDYIATLPTHYEFLKNEIYQGKDDYAV